MGDGAIAGTDGVDAPAPARRGGDPRLYVLVVVFVMLAAFVLHLRREGVFACPTGPYAEGWYLANCNAGDYGEYDHGAFWFGIESEAARRAAAADVVFLGNSRTQYGLSTPGTDRWFAERGARYYLLGFAYEQSSAFNAPLLEKLDPTAKAYVINADNFFREDLSPPGEEVVAGGARSRALLKRAWQPVHGLLCGVAAAICGDAPATYRHVETGQWRLGGVSPVYNIPRLDLPVNPEAVAAALPIAEAFIAGLPVERRCVVLTYVWTTANDAANAAALADALGVPFATPEVEGLTTFDGSHLDPPSAERFSQAFYAAAAPHLEPCIRAGPQSDVG